MKYIQKQAEPADFLAWKMQEAANISPDTKTANTIWAHFPSNCPPKEAQTPSFVYYSKSELKESILSEQGHLCCYCNQSLKNDHNTILEHLEDKGTNVGLTLTYSNIAASCNGGQKDPKPRYLHCDAEKNNQILLLKPTDELCELQLFFQSDGHIKASCSDGENAITVLNLDLGKLVRNRKQAIEGFIFADDDKSELIDLETAKILLGKMEQKNENNQFIEFCSAIKSVLERDFLPKPN